MINFSSLPTHKKKKLSWLLLPIAIVILVILVTAAIADQLGQAEKDMFMNYFQIFLSVVILIAAVVLITLPVIFIIKVIVPRMKRFSSGQRDYVPAYNNVSFLQNFANDNGFEFHQYSLDNAVPTEEFNDLLNVRPGNDVYTLYQIKGTAEKSNFSFYGLAHVENDVFMGSVSRRGLAYSTTSEGKRIDYMTLLKTDSAVHASPSKKIEVERKSNYTFVFTHGQAYDRETVKEMFDMLIPKSHHRYQ